MDQPVAVPPVYRPVEDGVITVYAGELRLSRNGVVHDVVGDLVLRLGERHRFTAEVAGRELWLGSGGGWQVDVPAGSPLQPPQASALSPPPADAESWGSDSIGISSLTAGDLDLVQRLVVHISGPLTNFPLPSPVLGEQRQLAFELPGWDLRMAAVDGSTSGSGFSFVISAIPRSRPIDTTATGRLRQQLFTLLSLVAGQQIGVAAVAGLDQGDQVVWAEWGAPRFDGFEQRTWRWCPPQAVAEALPALAQGMCALTPTPSLEQVVDRAINYLLVANGPGFLDVRIPVACSGLELLGWAVLQRHQWLTTAALGRLSAGQIAQLLCGWAGIPVDLPDHYTALAKRPKGQHDWAGPDIVFNVRNELVHPPKKLDDPAWPNHEELFQACQLATWYLELAILRLLDFDYGYQSRLEIDTPTVGVMGPMPWRS